MDCIAKDEEIQCGICLLRLPRNRFDAGAIHNKSNTNRCMCCINCSHPQCVNENCPICRLCRNEQCEHTKRQSSSARRGNTIKCAGVSKPLHSRLLPQTKEEISNYTCQHCRYPRCSNCGKEMTKKEKDRWRKLSNVSTWTCGCCLIVEFSQKKSKPSK